MLNLCFFLQHRKCAKSVNFASSHKLFVKTVDPYLEVVGSVPTEHMIDWWHQKLYPVEM